MPTEIAVALVGLCGSAIGSLAGVVASAKLTAYRIEQLEKKVDKLEPDFVSQGSTTGSYTI